MSEPTILSSGRRRRITTLQDLTEGQHFQFKYMAEGFEWVLNSDNTFRAITNDDMEHKVPRYESEVVICV